MKLWLKLTFYFSAAFMWQISFAGEFTHKLKDRAPTITITSPAKGDFVTTADMEIRWTPRGEPTSEFLGFVLHNERSGDRHFIGDAFSTRGKRLKRPVGGVKSGQYRIQGYHYGLKGDWTNAGWSDVFTLGPSTQKKFWTKWGQEKRMCQYFAGTDNYIIYDIVKITCNSGRCIDPKFYWLIGDDWALLDDRPSSLPKDKHLISIRCAPIPETSPEE